MSGLWAALVAAGIITAPMTLLLQTIRMILKGSLVSRAVMEDRLKDRDLIIESRDKRIVEILGLVDVLKEQNAILQRGNDTTLKLVDALPKVVSTPATNRSGSL